MASQGPNNPSAANGSGASPLPDWSNPTNVYSSDDNRATVSLLGSPASQQYSEFLISTGFGFSIPAGATINGIKVEIEKSVTTTSGSPVDTKVYLTKDGYAESLLGCNNKADVNVWPTSDAYTTYGGASDLWGVSWNDTEINASTFGVSHRCNVNGTEVSTTARVDHVRITVYYTEAGGGPTSKSRIIGGGVY